jgi:hypothetical protein
MIYVHRYLTIDSYIVLERRDSWDRIIPSDQHDYLDWLAAGGVPIREAAGRFLSVVNNEIVEDPNKASILAAEEAARQAEIARIAAKLAAINDNLPTWTQVKTAINNIGSLADAKAFLLRAARVIYWLAKDKAD